VIKLTRGGEWVNAAEEKSKHGVFQQSYLSVLLRKARSFDVSTGENSKEEADRMDEMVPGQSQLNCDSWTCSFWCRALAVVRIASEGERGRESMTYLAASNYARGWPVRGGFTAQRRIYTIEPQKQNK
jgi:hypothetical protein